MGLWYLVPITRSRLPWLRPSLALHCAVSFYAVASLSAHGSIASCRCARRPGQRFTMTAPERRAPAATEWEFRRYPACGILAHGFARNLCAECGHDRLAAYSSKCRGVYPSCTTTGFQLPSAAISRLATIETQEMLQKWFWISYP